MSENLETQETQESQEAVQQSDSSQGADDQSTADGAAQQAASEESSGAEGSAEGKQGDEAIQYEFKHPDEGAEYNPEIVSKFSELAGKHKLSQEAAQEILGEMSKQLNEIQSNAIDALRTQWQDEVRGDKEIGGDKLPETLSVAKKALSQFGDESTLKMLNESGFGDHPGVIKMFYKIGKEISEDSFVGEGQKPAEVTHPAKAMYPNLN